MPEEDERMDVRWVLRLYPRAWRARYEDEMLALLEQRPARLLTLLDLLLGALDAHLDPAALPDHGSPRSRALRQVRASSRLAFWAFPLFAVLHFAIIVDAVDVAWDTLRDSEPVAAAAGWVTAISVMVAVFTILGTGLILAVSRARAARSPGARLTHTLPLVAPAVLVVAAFAVQVLVVQGVPDGRVQPFLVFWLGILALPIIVGRAAARDALAGIDARLLLVAATIVTGAMIAELGGMMVSQAVASLVWPDGNWSPRLVFGLAMLLLPTMLAVRSVLRGYGALHEEGLA